MKTPIALLTLANPSNPTSRYIFLLLVINSQGKLTARSNQRIYTPPFATYSTSLGHVTSCYTYRTLPFEFPLIKKELPFIVYTIYIHACILHTHLDSHFTFFNKHTQTSRRNTKKKKRAPKKTNPLNDANIYAQAKKNSTATKHMGIHVHVPHHAADAHCSSSSSSPSPCISSAFLYSPTPPNFGTLILHTNIPLTTAAMTAHQNAPFSAPSYALTTCL